MSSQLSFIYFSKSSYVKLKQFCLNPFSDLYFNLSLTKSYLKYSVINWIFSPSDLHRNGHRYHLRSLRQELRISIESRFDFHIKTIHLRMLVCLECLDFSTLIKMRMERHYQNIHHLKMILELSAGPPYVKAGPKEQEVNIIQPLAIVQEVKQGFWQFFIFSNSKIAILI
jgi:hypothetical protein